MDRVFYFFAIALSFHKPPHHKLNNDRLFSQTHQMFKAIAISFQKPTIATHLKLNSDSTTDQCF